MLYFLGKGKKIQHDYSNCTLELNPRLHDRFDLHVNAITLINFIGLNDKREETTVGHTELNVKFDFNITNEVMLYAGVDNILNEAQPFASGTQRTRNDPGARFYYLGLSAHY